MNWIGIITGFSCFLIIGIFHPIVIKAEYHFSKKIWPVFLICGLICMLISLFVENSFGGSLLGVLGCSFLWSIGELKEQEERVRKGWFPRNEKRTYPFDKK